MIEQDNWGLQQYTHPSSPERSLFRKNLSPAIHPGSASHPYVCYLTFGFTPKDATGLPPADVADELGRIEETELPDLERGSLSILVGVVLKGGVKDFIFYTSDPDEFLERAGKVRSGHPHFKLGCEVGHDPDWSHYADLP